MVEIVALKKRFGQKQVLDGIDLHLPGAATVAFLGANGSGKTTLIKCLLGLVRYDGGQIKVMGKDIGGQWDYRRFVGYMPQLPRYPEYMTTARVVELLVQLRGVEHPDEELLDTFGVRDFFPLCTGMLSGGMTQKLSAALTFMFNAEIYVLDEPTAGLDPWAAEILKEKIRNEAQKGRLILITSHILNDLDELATHVAYLLNGKILFFSTIAELRSQYGEEKLSKILARLTHVANI